MTYINKKITTEFYKSVSDFWEFPCEGQSGILITEENKKDRFRKSDQEAKMDK